MPFSPGEVTFGSPGQTYPMEDEYFGMRPTQHDGVVPAEAGQVDPALVQIARMGDRPAFESLVERYQTLVCSVAYCITGRLAQSEEIAQETFLLAWTQLGRLRRTDAFRGWICGIARNLSCQAVKEQRTRRAAHADGRIAMASAPSIPPSPLEQMIKGEEEHALWRALSQLPSDYRLTFVLFYREQQSIPRLAQLLEVTEGAIKQRLSRGRRLLHERITADLEAVLVKSRPRRAFTVAVMLMAPFEKRASKMALLTGGGALAVSALVLVGGLLVGRGTPPERVIPTDNPMAPSHLSGGPARFQAATVASGADPAATVEDSPQPGRGNTLLGFDFESGVLPSVFTHGQITDHNCPTGSRYCAIGSIYATENTSFGEENVTFSYVQAASPEGSYRLYDYSDTTEIRFDYWLGRGNALAVRIHGPRGTYNFELFEVVHDRWAHARVRLADLVPTRATMPALRAGDNLKTVGFLSPATSGTSLYIDNVEVIGHEAGDPVPESTTCNVFSSRP